jgi:hypothetical protein
MQVNRNLRKPKGVSVQRYADPACLASTVHATILSSHFYLPDGSGQAITSSSNNSSEHDDGRDYSPFALSCVLGWCLVLLT